MNLVALPMDFLRYLVMSHYLLVANMIWIILMGIGLLAMLVGLGFVSFAETETEASVAYGLGLVGKFLCLTAKILVSVRQNSG